MRPFAILKRARTLRRDYGWRGLPPCPPRLRVRPFNQHLERRTRMRRCRPTTAVPTTRPPRRPLPRSPRPPLAHPPLPLPLPPPSPDHLRDSKLAWVYGRLPPIIVSTKRCAVKHRPISTVGHSGVHVSMMEAWESPRTDSLHRAVYGSSLSRSVSLARLRPTLPLPSPFHPPVTKPELSTSEAHGQCRVQPNGHLYF